MDPRVDSIIEDIIKIKKELADTARPEVPLGLSLISSQTLSGSVTTVTFSTIPQGFRHLQIICQARTDRATEIDSISMRFNSDTGANYDREQLQVNNATLSGVANRAQTSIILGVSEAANSRANNFSPLDITIYGYTRTDNEKWVTSKTAAFGDVSADSDINIFFFAGRWRNTAVISSITFLPGVGPNFVSGSRFDLYGVR